MSQSPRLSETLGINRTEDRAWPLNLALLAFGSVIVWIVFRYLKPDDSRWLYNPWFYAIVTPVGLLVLSILLGTLVSRLLERSAQLAFLLSMIVHLVLLVCAEDIVIVSRMWPDVFENIQRQRVILKKHQQIPKYFNVAASSLGNRRPDYLHYVPTKHRPTELSTPESEMQQLARSQQVALPNLQPEYRSAAKPMSIEREKPSLSVPSTSQEAAKKGRSELADRLKNSQLVESIQPSAPSGSQPEPLQAASATENRKKQKTSAVLSLEPKNNLTEISQGTRLELASISRSVREGDPSPGGAPSEQLPRARQTQSSIPTFQSIDISLAEDAASSSTPPAAVTPQIVDSRASFGKSPALREFPQDVPASLAPRVSSSNVERAATNGLEIPSSGGESESSVRTKTAGGQTSPAAALALKIQGAPSAAAPVVAPNMTPNQLSDLASRKSSPERSNSRMPTFGKSASPELAESPRMSSGARGTGASSLAERATSGQAPKFDVAGLVSDDSPLTRSAVGLSPSRGSASQFNPIVVSDVEGIAGLILQANQNYQSEADKKLTAQGTELVRSNQPKATVLSASQVQARIAPEVGTQSSANSPALSRAAYDSMQASSLAAGGPVGGAQRERIQSLAGTFRPAASQSKIEDVPAQDAQGTAKSFGQLSPVEADAMRRKSSALSSRIPLTIEAEAGQGGEARDSGNGVPLLARNADSPVQLRFTEIESTRFARNDVGSSETAGIKTPVPKPAFQQRIDRLKHEAGGTETLVGPRTELAIERGLMFLAKSQRADGSWRLQDFDTPVLIRSDTAATGLSLLAFQGAGYTHKQIKYAQVVDKALKFLIEHQLPSGDLYIPQDLASDQNAWLYSHSMATLALCEAYGMTQDEQLREPAQRAVHFMVASQDEKRGGWRYRPGAGTDTSVTGWFTMALKSAQLAGLTVPETTFNRLKRFLNASQVSKQSPHLYRYNPFAPDSTEQRHGLQPTAVMTSVGLLMRLYFGWQRSRPEMIAGADYLLENPPRAGTKNKTLRDTYYWYYATQVLFHMGGDRWKKWHGHLHAILIDDQIQTGEMAGSWDPYQPTADLWARYGGRLYVTTMNLLSLEVNYRHLPLYDATAK